MKFGIHYVYWRNDLGCESYLPYIRRAKKCGYDALELGDSLILRLSDQELRDLRKEAEEEGIELALGIDPPQDMALTSEDASTREAGIEFFQRLFPKFELLGLKGIGGNLLNAPARAPFSRYREMEYENAILSLRRIFQSAADYGLQISLEVVNRYEGHIANTAKDMYALLEAVGEPNGKILLDGFHANIEENSFSEAIHQAGDKLGHFHLQENHRGLLGSGHLPLYEIRDALRQIGYDGILTQESLVRAGGDLGDAVRLWRDMTGWADDEKLDEDAKASVEAMRYLFR